MTILQQTITIILCALGTMLTRFLPFLVFNPKKPTPKYIQYLGSALPGAIFGMLVATNSRLPPKMTTLMIIGYQKLKPDVRI